MIKKISTQENLKKVLLLFIFLQPFLDTYILFESNVVNFFGMSPSTIIRLVFMFIMMIMFMFNVNSRRQKIFFLIYSVLIIIYSGLHILNALNFNTQLLGNFNFSIFSELFYIVRLCIPLMILCISFNVKFNTSDLKKNICYISVIISSLIVFTNIFKISVGAYITKPINLNIFDWLFFNAHETHSFYDTATRAYFSFANMISSLLFGTIAMLYYQLIKKFSIKNAIFLFIQMLAMFMLGTKVATFGFLLTSIVMFIVMLFFIFVKKEFNFNKNVFLVFLFNISLWMLIYPSSPCFNRMYLSNELQSKDNKVYLDKILQDADNAMLNLDEKEKMIFKKEFIKNNFELFSINEKYILESYPYEYDPDFWYNTFSKSYEERTFNRNIISSIYDRIIELNNNEVYDKLFGLTYTRASNVAILERDILSQNYYLGILGSILFISPYILIILFMGIVLVLNYKNKLFKIKNVSLIVCLGAGLAGAFYCGNSLDNLTFIIIYAFIFGQLLRSVLITKEVKNVNEDEITILALHLGIGGVEKYISSLCKMLENDYKINIICTYKMDKKPAFEFSNKIKIKYLIDDYPRKEELKDSIRRKNIIKIIKYLFINIKLYILRYIRNVDAIKNIKSKFVITTRIFHNDIVNVELDTNHVKIATEHNYHNNNKKYINSLVSSINNFDYLVCVSEDLKEFYSNKIKPVKTVFIPNTIDEVGFLKKNELNNNIISVGRFAKEKGFLDLIDVFNLISQELKNSKLYLVGDGPEYEVIKNKIVELNLEDKIILTGFVKDKDKLNELYDNSSLYLMTSYTESFGIVLIEAMSHGVVCCAFDCANGPKNLLKEYGYLISDRNKKKMAKKAISLLKSKKEWSEKSIKSYEFSKKYDINNVKNDWVNLLKGE